MVVQPGDGQPQVTGPERLAGISKQPPPPARPRVRNQDGGDRLDVSSGLRPWRGRLNDQVGDLGRGTVPDVVLEPRPGDNDGCRPWFLPVTADVPGPIGADQAPQIFEIAAGCPRER